MQRFLIFVLLEGYAVLLAGMQGVKGVRTDEAKYLLNIPYPHPPLVRWILGQTEWMTYQEMFWRIVFATVLVQAVWFFWNLDYFPSPSGGTSPIGGGQGGGSVERGGRKIPNGILSVSWLLSAALFIEGGKIMMAPLTAIQGLIFVSILLIQIESRAVFFIGLLWMVSLFTAYQAVLFLPIVFAIFWRMKIPMIQKIVYVGGPIVLLSLYTLTNPLVIASMINVGGQQVSVPFIERLGGVLNLWMIGGSVIVSVLGVIGMMRAKSIPLIASLILVCAYIFLAHRAYYSVLFLPLLMGGMILLLEEHRFALGRIVGLMAVMFLVFVQQHFFDDPEHVARRVLSQIPQDIGAGDILISGPFGHEWQYESRVPIRRYKPGLLPEAQSVVCLSPCAEIEWRGWKRLVDDPVRVYVPAGYPSLEGGD